MGTKLSQIAPAGSAPAPTDQFVGVTGGTTDNLYTTSQIGDGIAAAGKIRKVLSSDTNYYVSVTGSDSNGGTDPVTDAWATLQHAMDIISNMLDLGGFTITVNIGTGTFAGFNGTSTIGGGQINWIGQGSSSTFINEGALFGYAFLSFVNNDTIFGFDKFTASSATQFAVWGIFNNYFSQVWGVVSGDMAFTMLAGQYLLFDSGFGNVVNAAGCTITLNYPGSGVTTTTPTFQWVASGKFIGDNKNFVFTGSPNFNNNPNLSPWLYFNAEGQYNGVATFTGTATGDSLNLNANSVYANGSFNLPTTTIGTLDGSSSLLIQGDNITFQDVSVFGVTPFGTVASVINKFQGQGYANSIANGNFWGPVKCKTDGPRLMIMNDGGTAYVRQIGNWINTQTSNYTISLLDTEGIVEMNMAGANTLTVDTDANNVTNFNNTFPVGTKISVVQAGAGATTIAAAVGVTLHNAGAIGGQWKSSLLYKRAANEWVQLNGAF